MIDGVQTTWLILGGFACVGIVVLAAVVVLAVVGVVFGDPRDINKVKK
jgi:predicted membrane channel-forming protein YqfA (hemolysin III family)